MTELTIVDDLPQSLLDTDPEVSLPATADQAALMVDWLGYKDLLRNPTYSSVFERVPKPKKNETPAEYTRRIWPLLEPDERGMALHSGLQKMVTMQRVAETGIWTRVWRAYQSGEWVFSPERPDDFRPWVRSVLVDTLDGSASEASQLAMICEAVMWLSANELPGVELPGDIESVFRRPAYRRWRAVASKILDHIEQYESVEGPEEKEAIEEIASLVGAVYDEEKTTTDLDQAGRKKDVRIPPIVITEDAQRDNLGRFLIQGALTRAQRSFFRRKMGDHLDYRLTGEQYNTQDYTLAEYREHIRWFCPECGVEWEPYPDESCTGCNEKPPELTKVIEYSRRAWNPQLGWSDWLEAPMLPPDGSPDLTLEDPEMGLKYLRYWEVK